jgi:hypothetical protein
MISPRFPPRSFFCQSHARRRLRTHRAARARQRRHRSDGMKKNPPNREFKILQPHKMEALDLKNPMATRAVDHTKDRRAKLEAEDSLNDLAQKDESFDTDEERAHRAFSKDVTQTKDGMSADELDNFMQSLRDVSASPVERHVAGSYRTHAPESRRSCVFWTLKPAAISYSAESQTPQLF